MKPQALQLVNLFERHGNRLTLHEIMQTHLAAEYRARMAELRMEGYRIECQRAKNPGENLYTMVRPEANGQLRLAV